MELFDLSTQKISANFLSVRKFFLSFSFIFFFVFCVPGFAFSQATIAFNKLDYLPGDTVAIVGKGFSPKEQVTLSVINKNSELVTADKGSREPWSVIADAGGNFFSSWFIPRASDEANALIKLTADGKNSELHAEVFFTGQEETRISVLGPFRNNCGETKVIVQAFLEYKSGSDFLPLAGKRVNFTLGNSTGSGVTTSSGIATAVLNVPVSASSLVSSFGGDESYSSSTNSLTFIINTAPVINSNPTGGNACVNSSFSFVVLANGSPAPTYQWKKNNVEISGATGSTYSISSATTSHAGNYSVDVTNACGTISSPPIELVVNPVPLISASPSLQNVCSGDAIATITLKSDIISSSYKWITNSPRGTIITPASGSGDINCIVTNNSETVQAVTFTIIDATRAGCSSQTTATVSVKPIPDIVATPLNQTVCSGTAISTIVLTGGFNGTTYEWSRENNSAVTGLSVNGYGNISGTLTNTSAELQPVFFRIIPSAGGCAGSPITATVNVNTLPFVSVANLSADNNTGDCGTNLSFSATVSGSPSPVTTYNVRSSPIVSPWFFPVGLTQVNIASTNLCGTKYASFNSTVIDIEIPEINCNATVNANTYSGSCSATVSLSDPVTSDNCGVASVVSDHPSSSFPVGTTVVTWTVTDVNGNTNTCAQNVVVKDNSIPSIICGGTKNATTDSGNSFATISLSDPITSDNCSVISVVSDHPSNSFSVGTTSVNWTATDVNGNTNTCMQNIVVKDSEIPSIICGGTVNATTDIGNCAAAVFLADPIVSDNFQVASLLNDHPSSSFTIGRTIVTWTATDVNGNKNTCRQNVVVTDDEMPSIICGGTVNATTDLGSCFATISIVEPVASDNCFVALLESDHSSSSFPVGTTIVNWIATDVNGNKSSCLQNIIVSDNEIPSIICEGTVNANTDSGCCTATVLLSDPAFSDNCFVALLGSDHTSTSFRVGTTCVTWTATDINGNTNSCRQNVVVNDIEIPVISNLPADIILPACISTANWIPPTATDNCSAELTSTHESGDPFQAGTTTIIYTAVDPYSNVVNRSFNVTRLLPLTETIATSDNTYRNACNGSATITADGGKPPYVYSQNELTFQASNCISELCEGTYPFTVKDADGCLISVNSVITQPAFQCGNLSGYTDSDLGGWGASATEGNSVGTWLYTYFTQVYPNGVSIGSAEKIITFNSACAISNWLPAEGTSRQFDFTGKVLINPSNGGKVICETTGTTYQNELASKVLALTLTIDFDKALPNFNSQSTITYADLIYTEAPFIGWKVSEILFEANRLLGQGAAVCGQTNSYYSIMTDVISDIINGKNTRCPNLNGINTGAENLDSLQSMHVLAYPNPFSTSFTIEFSAPEDGLVSVTIYSVNGELIATLFNETIKAGEKNRVVFNGENYAPGIYIYKLTAGDKLYFDRMILSR